MNSQMHFASDSKGTARVGKKWPVNAQLRGLSSLPEAFVVKIPLELTETAQFMEERRAFAIAVQAIREEEKARLARELHDELAQSLTALKMDTIWVRDHASTASENVTAKLNEMAGMLDRTVAATHRMAADLRLLMLDDLGLVPAIEWLASRFMQRCGVPCTFSVNDEMTFELPEPYATAVFRIVQESLNNIAKHAAASQVMVKLDKTPDTVRLRVQDDSCGFFSDSARKPQSLGLMGLRERAQLLGGRVVIHRVRGEGTSVEVSIPVNPMGVHQ